LAKYREKTTQTSKDWQIVFNCFQQAFPYLSDTVASQRSYTQLAFQVSENQSRIYFIGVKLMKYRWTTS